MMFDELILCCTCIHFRAVILPFLGCGLPTGSGMDTDDTLVIAEPHCTWPPEPEEPTVELMETTGPTGPTAATDVTRMPGAMDHLSCVATIYSVVPI